MSMRGLQVWTNLWITEAFKINCPVDSASQNLIGFQYKREIFYR